MANEIPARKLEKQKMVEGFREKNKACEKGQIVFAGSSLMEMFPIEAWAAEQGVTAYNRGVGGYTTLDMLPIIDVCVTDLMPKKLFINIGTNDLSDAAIPMDTVMERYERILSIIEEKVPGVRIYLMAYYPINEEAASPEMKANLAVRTNEKINEANRRVMLLAESKPNRVYIDVNAPLRDASGRLKAEYTIEGMHIYPEGYRAIFPDVMKYVKE